MSDQPPSKEPFPVGTQITDDVTQAKATVVNVKPGTAANRLTLVVEVAATPSP